MMKTYLTILFLVFAVHTIQSTTAPSKHNKAVDPIHKAFVAADKKVGVDLKVGLPKLIKKESVKIRKDLADAKKDKQTAKAHPSLKTKFVAKAKKASKKALSAIEKVVNFGMRHAERAYSMGHRVRHIGHVSTHVGMKKLIAKLPLKHKNALKKQAKVIAHAAKKTAKKASQVVIRKFKPMVKHLKTKMRVESTLLKKAINAHNKPMAKSVMKKLNDAKKRMVHIAFAVQKHVLKKTAKNHTIKKLTKNLGKVAKKGRKAVKKPKKAVVKKVNLKKLVKKAKKIKQKKVQKKAQKKSGLKLAKKAEKKIVKPHLSATAKKQVKAAMVKAVKQVKDKKKQVAFGMKLAKKAEKNIKKVKLSTKAKTQVKKALKKSVKQVKKTNKSTKKAKKLVKKMNKAQSNPNPIHKAMSAVVNKAKVDIQVGLPKLVKKQKVKIAKDLKMVKIAKQSAKQFPKLAKKFNKMAAKGSKKAMSAIQKVVNFGMRHAERDFQMLHRHRKVGHVSIKHVGIKATLAKLPLKHKNAIKKQVKVITHAAKKVAKKAAQVPIRKYKPVVAQLKAKLGKTVKLMHKAMRAKHMNFAKKCMKNIQKNKKSMVKIAFKIQRHVLGKTAKNHTVKKLTKNLDKVAKHGKVAIRHKKKTFVNKHVSLKKLVKKVQKQKAVVKKAHKRVHAAKHHLKVVKKVHHKKHTAVKHARAHLKAVLKESHFLESHAKSAVSKIMTSVFKDKNGKLWKKYNVIQTLTVKLPLFKPQAKVHAVVHKAMKKANKHWKSGKHSRRLNQVAMNKALLLTLE